MIVNNKKKFRAKMSAIVQDTKVKYSNMYALHMTPKDKYITDTKTNEKYKYSNSFTQAQTIKSVKSRVEVMNKPR